MPRCAHGCGPPLDLCGPALAEISVGGGALAPLGPAREGAAVSKVCIWSGGRGLALLALAALALGGRPASAERVPVRVNIGIGPTVGTVLLPSLGGPPGPSLGLAVRAEGYVNARTLHSKPVMRQVPRRYKGMAREMDDMHVVPFPASLLPDAAMILPLTGRAAGQSVRGVGWTPVSAYLSHQAGPVHRVVALSPRVGWLSLDADASDPVERSSHIFLGVDLNPERESSMSRGVRYALGGNIAPGFVGPRTIAGVAEAGGFGVWVDAFVRLQLRKTVRVKL